MNYIIREIKETDYNDYLRLINEFRETAFTEEEFKNNLKIIKLYSKIYVIEKDLKLIATGTLLIEQKFIYNCVKMAHIEDVCVSKDFRMFGFGKIIVNSLIEEAKKLCCYKVTLNCSETNILFYTKVGLEKRGYQMTRLL